MIHTTLIDAPTARGRLADPGWVFVDCRFDIRDVERGPREYRASHIQGAVYADLDKDLSGPHGPGPHGAPSPAGPGFDRAGFLRAGDRAADTGHCIR